VSYTLSVPTQTLGQTRFRRHGFQLRSRRLPFSHGPFIHSAVVFDVLMRRISNTLGFEIGFCVRETISSFNTKAMVKLCTPN